MMKKKIGVGLTILIQLSIEILVKLHVKVVVDGDLVDVLEDHEHTVKLARLFLKMHFLLESLHFENIYYFIV